MGPGTLVADRFEIESLAGSGGMGQVWRARDRVGGGVVALKVLRGGGEDPDERFRREAAALGGLRHPAIVGHVADGQTPAGQRFLAMEWIEGETLRARLRRGLLGVGEALALGRRVADALAAAHAIGIVHRDIKPSNILLPGGDPHRAMVIDFGIARFALAPRQITAVGAILGTYGYMAPEQAKSGDVDARADVFSLGCVLFECLSGRPPFGEESGVTVLFKVLLEEVPAVQTLRPEAPAALASLVGRMLAKTREHRPPDGAAVAGAMETIDADLGDEPTSAGEIALASAAVGTSERRLMSVMLAGRRSGPLAVPDEQATVADGESAALHRLREVSERFGASLDRLIDGSILVSIAADGPIATATDLAARAARCALAMSEILRDEPVTLATGRAETGGPVPVGDLVDRLARLPGRPGTVRIDEVTAGLLDPRFEVGGDDVGLLLVSERETDTPRTLLGRETPCLGRERELALVEGILRDSALQARPHVVVVTGAPGVGKSRLRHELASRFAASEQPPQVWLGRGEPFSAGSPLGLFAQAIRRTAGLREGEPIEVRRRKLAARIGRCVSPELRTRVAEFIGEIVGTPFDDRGSPELAAAREDAILMGDQMQRAVEDFVDAEALAGPLVLVLEDLHWGDLPTVRLCDRLLRNLEQRPLLVVAYARPEVNERFPGIWSNRFPTRIDLPPIGSRAAERLVRGALGDDAPADRVDALVERAGGHPFLLEELTRAAAEGRWDALPESAVAMAQARLDALEPQARRVARAASVFGVRSWRRAVGELLGGGAAAGEAERWLHELAEREILTLEPQSRFPGEIEYAFRHALLREAAYAALPESDRRTAHRIAAHWLEQAGETDPLPLALHFEAGGEAALASRHYLRAAESALEGHDFQAVLDRVEQAVASGAAGETLGALRLTEAEAHYWRGENAELERSGTEAIALLPVAGAPWFDAHRLTCSCTVPLGRPELLETLGESVRATPPKDAAAGTARLVAAASISIQLTLVGRRELADALLGEVQTGLDEMASPELALVAHVHMARSRLAALSGDFGLYVTEQEAAAVAFEKAGNTRRACRTRVNLAFGKLELGLDVEAEADLRAALGDAIHIGLPVVCTMVRSNLGLALVRQGRHEEARREEEEAVEGAMTQGDRRLEGITRVYLAWIRAPGDPEAAMREAERGVELLREFSPLFPLAIATLGRLQLAAGRASDALEAALHAVGHMKVVGRVEEGESLIRLVHAEALHATGDTAGATGAIREARDRLLARAGEIASLDWRESFLAIPEHARTLALAGEWLSD